MGEVKTRRRRNERKEVRIITDEWVETNCINVTVRDQNMLRLLTRFPLMNSEHLRLLTPGGGGEKPFYELSQGTKRCNDRIRMLYDLHCINKWSPRLPLGHGTSKQYVALDRAGCRLLNVERRIRNDLPVDWKHRSLILDLYASLIVGERADKWTLHYNEVEEKQRTFPLIPDLTTIVRKDEKGAAFFIEVDRSEKKESVEREKLRHYRDWQQTFVWQGEAWIESLPRPLFPFILYLFDETKTGWQRRAGLLATEAKSIGLLAKFIGFSQFPAFMETFLS